MRRTSQDRPLYERVKEHVRYSGLTDEQIAKEADWSVKRVQRLLSGDTRLLAEDMLDFARVLRKPVADLFLDPPRGHAP